MFTVAFNVNVLMLLLMLIPVGYLVMLSSLSFTVIIQVDYVVLENCVFCTMYFTFQFTYRVGQKNRPGFQT